MKKERGITLVALVITIVVLLILAGVAITALTGENNIIGKAKEAKEKQEEASANEDNAIKEYGEFIDSQLKTVNNPKKSFGKIFGSFYYSLEAEQKDYVKEQIKSQTSATEEIIENSEYKLYLKSEPTTSTMELSNTRSLIFFANGECYIIKYDDYKDKEAQLKEEKELIVQYIGNLDYIIKPGWGSLDLGGEALVELIEFFDGTYITVKDI